MTSDLLQQLAWREITKANLFEMVEADFSLLTRVLEGTVSTKASVRYGCASVLVNLCDKHPDRLYPYFNDFVAMLDSKYRILSWNAMAAITNLTVVDSDRKFDATFDKYFSYLSSEYMVTVVNVVGNAAKIAQAKPSLTKKITAELLKVQNLQTTPHLTEECKLVIAEQALKAFDIFFDQIENKEQVIAFAQKHLKSSRVALRKEAQRFVKNWDRKQI